MSIRSQPTLGFVRLLLLVTLSCLPVSCSDGSASAAADAAGDLGDTGAFGGELLVEAAESTGLDFVHRSGAAGDFHMPEILGSGGALLDYDRDGDLDVFLVQSGPLEVAEPGSPSVPDGRQDRLYRNELAPSRPETLRFVDVTSELGLDALELDATIASGYGMGVVVGDYDGDGWPDLYLTSYGPNRLLRNLEGRSFRDVTAESGAGDRRWSTAATFFDYDRDGHLDLFVGNYVDYPLDRPPPCLDLTGAQDYCGPGRFQFQSDRLLRNRGDGTFEDATARAGLGGVMAPALGVVAADLDDDGWQDLYVANDAQPNNLWRNQGDGTFSDVALVAGCALNALGRAEGSMGVDVADFDDDGDLDLFMTHLLRESNTLYLNDGSGQFEDRSQGLGLAGPSLPFTSFGTAFVDVDLDGWLDLYVASGSIANLPELSRLGDPYPFHQTNQLFRNTGSGRFVEITAEAGEALSRSRVSRGVAVGDVDNDGDQDLLVTNNNGPVELLINTTDVGADWVGLSLLERSPGGELRPAIGASAALLDERGTRHWRRVRVAGSYASASDPRIVIALRRLGGLHGVTVRWADGRLERWPVAEPGRYSELVRGGGEAWQEPAP